MALGLEFPEDTLVNLHGWDTRSETYGKLHGGVASVIPDKSSSSSLALSSIHEILSSKRRG